MISLEEGSVSRPRLNEPSGNARTADKPLRPLTPEEPGEKRICPPPFTRGIISRLYPPRHSTLPSLVNRLLFCAVVNHNGFECTYYFLRKILSEVQNEPLVIS